MAKQQREYAVQYGYWYSFTQENFIKMLQAGAKNESFDLLDFGKELKNEPQHYWNYIKPLDWSAEDYQEKLDELNLGKPLIKVLVETDSDVRLSLDAAK